MISSDLDLQSMRNQLGIEEALPFKSTEVLENLKGFHSRVVLEVSEAPQNLSPEEAAYFPCLYSR